jgi:hypothetical protein
VRRQSACQSKQSSLLFQTCHTSTEFWCHPPLQHPTQPPVQGMGVPLRRTVGPRSPRSALPAQSANPTRASSVAQGSLTVHSQQTDGTTVRLRRPLHQRAGPGRKRQAILALTARRPSAVTSSSGRCRRRPTDRRWPANPAREDRRVGRTEPASAPGTTQPQSSPHDMCSRRNAYRRFLKRHCAG